MERRDGKTTIWVPKESFESVQKLWKPEFNWIPVPVDRSLPPDQIAYIETGGPVSPLPAPRRAPGTPLAPPSPLSPLPLPAAYGALPKTPRTPRTPLDLPPLATTGLGVGGGRQEPGYFARGASPELIDTAITAGFSSPGNTDAPDTPSTATEPESPTTPGDSSPGLPKPALGKPSLRRNEYRQTETRQNEPQQNEPQQNEPEQAVPQQVETQRAEYQQNENQQNEYQQDEYQQPDFKQHQFQQPWYRQPEEAYPPQPDYASLPWKMFDDSVKWKMTDVRGNFRPKPQLQPARWKELDGGRELKMSDHWQTFRRDEAHWNGSKKGFAVRLDMNLNVEVEMRGTVNGDITLSAEALYVSAPGRNSPCFSSFFSPRA